MPSAKPSLFLSRVLPAPVMAVIRERFMLVNEPLDPGSYPVTWDGTDESGALVPAGNYIAHMTAGDYNGSVKMSLDRGTGN